MRARQASITTILATMLPTMWALPTESADTQFKLPTCGAELCLPEASGFNDCAPNDLACLCSLEQEKLNQYVGLVQPCIDGQAGKTACTDGARYQYKDLLTSVCAMDQFGNKDVKFPSAAPTSTEESRRV